MRTACTQHCNNSCSLLVEEQDGKISIRGNPDHPFTRGLICRKIAQYNAHRTRADRLTEAIFHDKSTGRRTTISFEDALDRISAKIELLRKTPQAILPLFGNASFGVLSKPSKYIFQRLGASVGSGSLCLSAGNAAMKMDFGAIRSPSLNDLAASRGIVNFGHNIRSQGIHIGREIALARSRGTSVLTISPGDFNHGEEKSPHCIIRPGTDRFFVAAVMRLLFDEDRLDHDALKRSVNTNAFLELLKRIDIPDCLNRCDLTIDDVKRAADIYSNGPTATILGRGLQRYAHGGETVRFIDALALATGNLGRRGGGLYYSQTLTGQLGPGFPVVQGPPPRRIRKALLGKDLLAADPPVEMVWIEGTNPVTQAPDSHTVAQALTDRFTVVVDAFMTDTAQCADIILPCALMLEVEDIVSSSNHECVNYAAKVFAPPAHAKSNYDIARNLFHRLFPTESFPTAHEIMATALAKGKTGADIEELKAKGFVSLPALATPFADRFDHDDGLARLPEKLTNDNDTHTTGNRVRLTSYIQKDYILSQIPPEAQSGLPNVFISPENPILKTTDLTHPVELVTEKGSLKVQLCLHPGMHREDIWFPRGGWMQFERCVNALVEARLTDIGEQAAFYEQRVTIRQSS